MQYQVILELITSLIVIMFSEIPNEIAVRCERFTNNDAILLYGSPLYFGWYGRQQHNLPDCKTGSTLRREILKNE